MKIEDIKNLLDEIGLDEDGYGYIDCTTATEYTDNNQYERIVAAIKQNIVLQQENTALTKKIEEVEKQGMESLIQVEKLAKEKDDIKQQFLVFMSELCDYFSKTKDMEFPIRIGDYKFEVLGNDLLVYNYDPIQKPEPIELKIKITENLDKVECPLCGNPLGKYPAISRKDNKTKICSNCGTLEALAAFKESLKDDKTNEENI
jgi:predicted RNA-binding Zn-ribbon protein involved in translation (DUF1610 family)